MHPEGDVCFHDKKSFQGEGVCWQADATCCVIIEGQGYFGANHLGNIGFNCSKGSTWSGKLTKWSYFQYKAGWVGCEIISWMITILRYKFK